MKILFLAANPQSTSRLNLGQEVQEIEEGLKRSKLSDKFQLVQRWEVRPRDLRRALLEENPDIVHFSGHGKGSTGLVLVDNAGKPKPATGEALAGLFIQFPSIKCVLLNACYAEIQARSIVKHIDYVIGMQDTILDDAAIAFTTGFYDGLGYGRNIEDAFALGRNAILWELSSFSDTTRDTRKLIPVDFTKTEEKGTLPENLKPILLKKSAYLNPQIPPNNEVKIANSIQTENHDSREQYLARVQEYLADRVLTPIAKFQLATLAKQLEISESAANDIVQAELQKIEQAKANYQTVLRQTIEEGHYPFNSMIEQQLKELQTTLKLTDSEVAAIDRETLQQAKIDRQIRSRTKKLSFEVITVNEKGKEKSRTRKEAEVFKEDLDNGVSLEMVKIPSGKFLMGTDDEEIARLCKIHKHDWFQCEVSQHQVDISSFFMGKHPITQAQWKVVASMDRVLQDLEPNPSHFEGDNLPVEQVCWDDAVEFCARLSRHTGHDYRLPSEAEWEYACRAGTNTPFHFGATLTTDLANYRGTDWEYEGNVYSGNFAQEPKGQFREKTTEVGIFHPNAFGLYDMHGNIWEWCADNWHKNYDGAPLDSSVWLSENSNYNVIRGGSWEINPDSCRSAIRTCYSRVVRLSGIGFRVVCITPRTT